ncbi:MAG: hypothetical protein H9789_12240 [Candidatus Paraprevotella stercoravium]|uniref:Preprotein translocase subunit SecB n=1 Tax=Candidatus Paraprevotella stercoravium TaxID=2838725 RepID=A0A9E2L8D7_9BACT|nr:hypothetical protein [Candidatus Paraprevotella stercoravium]
MDIRYRLESINETEFRFNYDFNYGSLSSEMINIQIGHDMKPFMEDDRIVVHAKVNIVETSTDTVLVTNAISMSFGLSPIKSIISFDSEGNVATQDTQVLDTFIIATIGALRGVLMKNLKGTPLGFVSIPLIPIENFRSKNKK